MSKVLEVVGGFGMRCDFGVRRKAMFIYGASAKATREEGDETTWIEQLIFGPFQCNRGCIMLSLNIIQPSF